MPDNPYPEWRRRACVHCEAALPMSELVSNSHKASAHNDRIVGDCTAPSAEEYIAALEEALRPFADLRARMVGAVAWGDSAHISVCPECQDGPTVGDLRRAKEVLDGR